MPADNTTTINLGDRKRTHKEQLALTARLVRELRRLLAAPDSEHRASASDFAPLKLICLAMLAQRALLPTVLAGTASERLLETFSAGQPLKLDKGNFATKLITPLALTDISVSEAAAQAMTTLFQSTWAQSQLANPLLPGWAFQHLTRQPRAHLAGISPGSNPQSASAEDINPQLVPALTQWFTPQWIASFLVDETISSFRKSGCTAASTLRFLDPACGAGHLLLPALDNLLVASIRHDKAAPAAALTRILLDNLFGCDIDPLMIQLSGFAIYLAARKITDSVDLPLPQLFHFGSKDIFGSLGLGVDQLRREIELIGPTGPIQLLDSKLAAPFSVIVANPPFLGHRLIPAQLSAFLKTHFYAGRFDLYAAFLSLCSRLLEQQGRMGLICQQSFMSITRYQTLRNELLERCDIEALVQLGAGTFGSLSGEKINNAIIIASRRSEQTSSHEPISCWRILSSSDKEKAEQSGIRSIQPLQQPRSQFATINGASFSFWCPAELMRLFKDHPPLQSDATEIDCVNGLFTCNNALFVKHHRDVRDAGSQNWVPYDKGGGHKWYRQTPYLLNWTEQGRAIREYRLEQGQSSSLPGERYYFQRGITYSYIGTKGFSARLLSPGSIFDIASSSLFSKRIDLYFVLGLLNSALARYLLGVLNPTVNFQIGDLRRLPFAIPDSALLHQVVESTQKAVQIAKLIDTFNSNSPSYCGPVLFRYGKQSSSPQDLCQAYAEHTDQLKTLNETESKCQSRIDCAIFELYKIGSRQQKLIFEDPWVARTAKHLAVIPSLERLRSEALDHLSARRSITPQQA